MKFDLEELIGAAARAAVEKVAGEMDQRVEKAMAKVLDQRDADHLVGLHKLRGGTAASARMFLGRHADLRSLGVKVGSRLLFKKSDWHAWLAAKKAAAK